jgi:hypothetical protein
MPQHLLNTGDKVIRVREVACTDRPIVGTIIKLDPSKDQWNRPVLRCTVQWSRSVSWCLMDSLALATPANLRKSQRKISAPKRTNLSYNIGALKINMERSVTQEERSKWQERLRRYESELADLDEMEEKIGKG